MTQVAQAVVTLTASVTWSTKLDVEGIGDEALLTWLLPTIYIPCIPYPHCRARPS